MGGWTARVTAERSTFDEHLKAIAGRVADYLNERRAGDTKPVEKKPALA
jgi:hypothetical protein